MTWEQTHRRMDALAEAEAALKVIPDQIPWRPEYEELFGTPAGLAEALRYRWRLRLQVHLDPELGDKVREESPRPAAARNAGPGRGSAVR